MGLDLEQFKEAFNQLTGNPPLSWQHRLFNQWMLGEVRPVIDLPTGMGKTSVIPIWLIARAHQENRQLRLPTRMIYVVDRRTVVDQATDLAMRLAAKMREQPNLLGSPPAISTLRGQLADNREWSRDPSRPAIIIGTVDLIGSALLFSGYRSSMKRQPLEAGLLGQDSLLILDEAHLSKPFGKLLDSIEQFNKIRDARVLPVDPLRVIRMSATSGQNSDAKAFQLEGDFDERTGDFGDQTVRDRFSAIKSLSIVESDKPTETIAIRAHELAKAKPGSRIVIFVQTPRQVTDVRKSLEKKDKAYPQRIAQLTGTMRGLERDELVDTEKPLGENDHERRVMQRFLKPDDDRSRGECFLISTSAGEVGFDLNADHMVCDATTVDSLIQRLGRVNRRGKSNASVIIVSEPTKKKDGKPVELRGLDLAIANTMGLLRKLRLDSCPLNVSPRNLAALKSGAWKDGYAGACTPEPATVELTDILLDNWSMTSIIEKMPGRPDVGPWLRGIADDQAQTTVAWRAEIELFENDSSPEKALQAIFAKHPIRPHESLMVNTGYLLEFLKTISKLKDQSPDMLATRVAIRLPRGLIFCRTLKELLDDSRLLYAETTLILPASFGGLNNSGMLDVGFMQKTGRDGEPKPPGLDVADRPGYEQTDEARSRLRILIERSENGSWSHKPLPGSSIPQDIKLEPNYDKSTNLFNDLKPANLRVRLVQPIGFDDEGNAIRSILILAPAPVKKNKEDQSLTDHVEAVEVEAERIADALNLSKDDPVRIAFLFAAKWHDEGKKARIWQTFANGPMPDGQPKGKMAQARSPQVLKRYRHEFGSLLRIQHADRCGTNACALPDNCEARDLAPHLIATHHGDGRPHFPTAVYDPFNDAERDALHAESIRRFARLQRRYGWWYLTWLENLLRCADALASADEESTEIDELGGGDQ